MLKPNTPEITFALATARAAGLLARTIQTELAGASLTKEDRSPVTIADFVAQALVAHLLEEAFPHDQLVGEEEATDLPPDLLEKIAMFVARQQPDATPANIAAWIDRGRAAPHGRYWVLDPIDGTKGFLRGEQYATALALIEDGQVILGVLACPNLEESNRQSFGGVGSLVVAARSQGAWTTPLETPGEFTQLRVSDLTDPAGARLLRSVEASHTNIDQLDVISGHLGVTAQPQRLDSQAKYALLAAGAGDLLFRLISAKAPDYKEKIWDQAAGALICEEAGGIITDLDGKPLDFTQGRTLAANRGVLASNGHLHAAALGAIQTAGA